MDRNSGSFQCKKWTLVTLCLLAIVATIVEVSLIPEVVNQLVDNQLNSHSSVPKEVIESIKHSMKIFVIVSAIIEIPVHLVGFMGAYRENLCLTLTYAVFTSLGVVAGIVSLSLIGPNPYLCVEFAFISIVCVITYSLAYDLRRFRDQAFRAPIGMVSVLTPPVSGMNTVVASGDTETVV